MQPHYLTKTLAAASATKIALSQTPGAGAIILNGAAAAGGGAIATLGTITAGSGGTPATGTQAYFNVPLTGGSGTGAVAGSILVINGAVAAVSMIGGSPGSGYVAGDSLGAATASIGYVGGFAVAVSTVTAPVATLDTQRRVLITSGGTDTGITFTVTGTNDVGQTISETLTGGSSGSPVYTNLDFKTVTGVTHTGSVASTVTIGTNGVGSTPWFLANHLLRPYNASLSGGLQPPISGSPSVTWQVEYTYDDPNNLPSGAVYPATFMLGAIGSVTSTSASTAKDGSINDPVAAIRFTITAGTSAFQGTIIEAGLNS
jgi:hypothetical protein